MTSRQRLTRLLLASLAFAGLGACTIVPAQPGYVEHYPSYGYRAAGPSVYYEQPRYYEQRVYREQQYPQHHRHSEPRRMDSPLDDVARMRRHIHRRLGLP